MDTAALNLIINMIIGFLLVSSAILNLNISIKNRKMTKIINNHIKRIQELEDFLIWPEIKKKQ